MKKKTIFQIMIIVITILAIILPFLLVPMIGSNHYYYLVRPLLWIFIALVVFLGVKKQSHSFNFNRFDIRELAFIGSLMYVIIYFLSGIFMGYTKSPLSHTLVGLLQNFWLVIPVVIAREVIRSKVIQTTNYKHKWFILIYLTIFFILLDVNFNSASMAFTSIGAMAKFMYKDLLPSIVLNVFMSYLVYKEGLVSALLFKIPYVLVFLISPVYLSNNYAMICVIQTIAPLLIFVKIENTCNYNNTYGITIKVSAWDRIKKGLMLATLIFLLGFTLGVLPYAPIVIASNSMYPVIKRGDIVILEKTSLEKLKIGDIIEYRLNGLSIIHRVKEIKENYKQGTTLITKGDNNQSKDAKYVTKDQVHGKIVSIVPKLGYPTLWFKELVQGKAINSDIEMGEVNAK